MEFLRYGRVPAAIAEKLIAESEEKRRKESEKK
jgi:hypothetical protein